MSYEECRLARLDALQLAWAAGFFDGEGTTVAAARSDRPAYVRLHVTLPQCGHGGVPEVLLRSQTAILGVGHVTGPDDHDMYFWRASGFNEAQAVIALLWRWLGPVKRAQAAAALRAVQRQYDTAAYRPRRPRSRGRDHTKHVALRGAEVQDTTQLDLAWAAGFLDAEGHFGLPRSVPRKSGSAWKRLRVSASQHGDPGRPADVLLRLGRILGGGVERHGEIDDHRWVSERAEEVESIFMRVRPWLGTVKQEQARHAIDIFRSQERMHGTSSRCKRGHGYDHPYLSPTGPKRRCNACARIVSRMSRARRGIRPRQFRNVHCRYTF